MKRLTVASVLGLVVLALVCSPLLQAADQAGQAKSGRTLVNAVSRDNADAVIVKQEAPRNIFVFGVRTSFSFHWSWIGIAVINVSAVESLKSDRPADPPPQRLEEESGDDNGWEHD